MCMGFSVAWARQMLAMMALLCICYIEVNAQAKKPKASANALNTLIIDAGHGAPDPGAVWGKTTEASITLAIAKELALVLKKEMPTLRVILTRPGKAMPCGCSNTNTANRRRAAIANQYKGDLFLSIHVNAAGTAKPKKGAKPLPSPSGTSTYVWASNRNDIKRKAAGTGATKDKVEGAVLASLRTKQYFSRSLTAGRLMEQQLARLGRKSKGVLQRNSEGIWVLQATNMPAILVETGYITHAADRAFLTSKKGVQQIARAMVKAIEAYKKSLQKK